MLQQKIRNIKANRATGATPTATVTAGTGGEKHRLLRLFARSNANTIIEIYDGASVIHDFDLPANTKCVEFFQGEIIGSANTAMSAKVVSGTGSISLVTGLMP